MTAIMNAYDGYFGRGTQTALATGVPATKFQRITDATVTYKEPNKKVVPDIAKGRMYTQVSRGGIEVSGGVSGFLSPDEIFGGIGWADLMGASNTVSGSAGTGYLHTFNDSGAFSVFGQTQEIQKGNSSTVMWDMIGMFLSKLSLEIGSEDLVKFSADYVGVSEATGGTSSAATFTAKPPAEGWMVDILVASSLGASFTSLSITTGATFAYDNKLKMAKGIGSRYAVNRSLGRPDITLDFTQIFQDDLTVYNYFKNNTENAVKIVITHDSLAGTSSGVYSWTIYLPRVTWLGNSPELTGQEEITKSGKLQALQDPTYGYACKVEILNSESGAYTL